jgi:hypothetical protein
MHKQGDEISKLPYRCFGYAKGERGFFLAKILVLGFCSIWAFSCRIFAKNGHGFWPVLSPFWGLNSLIDWRLRKDFLPFRRLVSFFQKGSKIFKKKKNFQ